MSLGRRWRQDENLGSTSPCAHHKQLPEILLLLVTSSLLGSPPPLHTHFADSSYYASTSPPLIFLYSYLSDQTMASYSRFMPS